MRTENFDLVVVGSGVASVAARKCAQAGWKVAMVDERPPGGTCALRGCSPKKMLRSGAAVIDFLRRMEGHGVGGAERITTSWKDLAAFAASYTGPIPENNRKIYEKMGVEFLDGHASFTGEGTMELRREGADVRQLPAHHFVLAAGARPADLGMDGAEDVLSSDDFLVMESLPRRIVFIGGGFISMEFAHIAARMGAECTVVHPRERPLSAFDPDLVDMLVEASAEHAGIRFVSHSRVGAVRRGKGGFVVEAKGEDGGIQTLEADLVVHGAGRTPNLEGLGLDRAGVPATRRGVTVNKFMQSIGNPRVYAAGDCADTGAPHITMVASREGIAVMRNLLDGNKETVNYDSVTSVAFTLPAIASCGLSEAECDRRGLDYDVRFKETARWFTNRHVNEPAGGFKVLIEKGTERLLGAHFLGHHCEEFANLFTLALHHGMTRRDMKSALWAHPSAASDLARILG